MSRLGLFWWSPLRSLRLLKPELQQNPAAWVHLARAGGRPLRNFGDEFSPTAFELCTGKKPRWAAPGRADLVAVGSVLELCFTHGFTGTVWGSGLRLGTASSAVSSDITYLAVRGPQTRRALNLDSNLTCGDPGVFASQIIRPSSRRRSGIVAVPHFRTWATAQGRELVRRLTASGISVVPPTGRPETVAQSIAESDLVVTESLHGLIFAHSIGVPALLVHENANGGSEPDFKYRDYLTTVGAQFLPVTWEHMFHAEEFRQARALSADSVNGLKTRSDQLAENMYQALRPFRSGS